MKGRISRIPLFVGVLLPATFALLTPAQAIPTITCHCFTDRSFDPVKPALADPYFLAMTQNTLFAQLFKVDKKSVVMKKQQGVSSDDLWIAHWVASRSGQRPESLLQAKNDKVTWQEVLASSRFQSHIFGAGFTGALQSKANGALLAAAVVEELLRSYRLLSEDELTALRQAGADNQEKILATVIFSKTRKPASQIYREVKAGTTTWGRLLQQARIEPKNMALEVSGMLAASSPGRKELL